MKNTRSLIAFFILAYALSWVIQIPLALSTQGIINVDLPPSLHLLSAYGPLVAAFIVTAFTAGLQGVRDLLARMIHWRVGWRWALFALLSPLALFLLAVLIERLTSGSWSAVEYFGRVVEVPQLSWFAGWLAWILTFGFGEETGWRGFALPRLQFGRSAIRATLILWIFWAFWHAPQFFYNFPGMTPFSSIGFLLGMLAGGILLTSLFNSTSGSILMVALWHGTYNAAVAGAQGFVPMIVTAGIVFIAISFWQNYGVENLSPLAKQTIPPAQ
jgi:membrane protease YdiL (CAAX protease family)